MEKDDDFLDAVEADNLAEAGLEPEVKEPEATPEPEPQEPAPSVAETPTEQKAPQGFVPLSAMLDERDKRKAEADRVAALEAHLQRVTQGQQQQQQYQAPDPLEDPEGYHSFVTQQVEFNAANNAFNMSELMARQQYGDDVVNAAQQWAAPFKDDPEYHRRLRSTPHPYATVIADYKRATALQKLGDTDGIDDFLAWKTAQQQLATTPTQAAPTAAHQQQAPPRSIASAPSAGGVSTEIVPTEDEMFDEVIKGL